MFTKSRLIFSVGLSFLEALNDVTINNTESTCLCCEVQSTEIPYKVAWSRNGVQILNGERHRIGRDGHKQTLEVSSSVVPDSGTYTCTISCPGGSVRCSATLAVIGTLSLSTFSS